MAAKVTNNAMTTLAAAVTAAAASISVAAGTGAKFPTLAVGDWCYLTITNAAGLFEVVQATARAGDVLTVTRGVDNTTALAWAAGDSVALSFPAALVNEILTASSVREPYADAVGTVDAFGISIATNQVNSVLYDGYRIEVGSLGANTVVSPQFAPTLNGVVNTARPIVKFVGGVRVPLSISDTDVGVLDLRYDLPNLCWVLMNPRMIPHATAAGSLTGGALGAVPYQSALDTTALLPAGANNSVLTSRGPAAPPAWAVGVTNLLGGVAGSMPVQSALDTTVMLPPGTAGQVLTITPAGAVAWTAGPALPVGAIIDFAGAAAPAGYLVCPTVATVVIRASYPTLFAAIGTQWGAGDGVTTFGLPWFPADYTAVQSNGNVGTQSVGQVLSHTHGYTTPLQAGGGVESYVGGTAAPKSGLTAATGGTANLAAGVRVLKCVKYL